MTDIIFGVLWLGAMTHFAIDAVRINRKAKRDSEKLNKIYKNK